MPVDFRSLHRDLTDGERNALMLNPGALARAKVYAALDLRQSTAAHLVDVGTMLTEMGAGGEAWLDRTARELYSEVGWRFDGQELGSRLAGGLALTFRINSDQTREELRDVLSGDPRQVNADLQGLLGYAAERMSPEMAEKWLRGYGRLVQTDIRLALGVEPGQLDRSVDERLRKALERDRGTER